MIVHPEAFADPKFFLSDLEVLLRRYNVSIEAAVVVTLAGPVVVTGFRGPRWLQAADTTTIDHRTARKLYEIAAAGGKR